MNGSVVWCDIPVQDLERAIRFYAHVLGVGIEREIFPGGGAIGLLPHEGGHIGGCLFVAKETRPSDQGVLVYLSAEGRLEEAVAAVEPHGGKVLEPPRQIGEHGYRALVLDSEGNRIALHSP